MKLSLDNGEISHLIFSRPSVRKLVGHKNATSEEICGFYEDMACVYFENEGAIIGAIYIDHFMFNNVIVHPVLFWDKAQNLSSAKMLINYIFESTVSQGIYVIIPDYKKNNIEFAEMCGLTKDTTLKEFKGEHDCSLMSIRRSTWEKTKIH